MTSEMPRGLDAATTEFYDLYAVQLTERPEARQSAMSARFAAAFRPSDHVLDVGAGSGRDMAVLSGLGCEVYGVEPNAAMRAFALRTYPQLDGRIVAGALPELGDPFGVPFDGIVCSAVLMHVAEPDVEAAFRSMSGLLVAGGRLLVSVPEMDVAQLRGTRDGDGRLFTNHAMQALVDLAKSCRLRDVGRWTSDAVVAQSGIRWHERLLIKEA